jgi:DNA invertase Pin-like site-specific DNA recombinase
VLVWKLDRFGRSALDVLSNIEALDRAGVSFVATTQGLETGPKAGAMGKLVATVLAAIAEFEREIIRERTRLGHAAARRKGVHIGRPPVEVTGLMVEHARELHERYGYSWPRAARALEVKGYPKVHAKTLARAVAGTKAVAGYGQAGAAPGGPRGPVRAAGHK